MKCGFYVVALWWELANGLGRGIYPQPHSAPLLDDQPENVAYQHFPCGVPSKSHYGEVLIRRFEIGCGLAAAMLFGLSMSGCGAAHIARTPAEQARADAGVQHYTVADVSFLQGMIRHHAQAIVMAGWAQTHGASEDVKILASRIDVGQRDEIAFMQRWLRERKLMAPEVNAAAGSADHHAPMQGMSMPGMSMPDTLMPGMLTPPQMAQLSAAAGAEFDQLFLTLMIQHHTGALTMVNRLFGTTGAGREELVFRFASDVSTDQTTEINRMRSMIAARTH